MIRDAADSWDRERPGRMKRATEWRRQAQYSDMPAITAIVNNAISSQTVKRIQLGREREQSAS